MCCCIIFWIRCSVCKWKNRNICCEDRHDFVSTLLFGCVVVPMIINGTRLVWTSHFTLIFDASFQCLCNSFGLCHVFSPVTELCQYFLSFFGSYAYSNVALQKNKWDAIGAKTITIQKQLHTTIHKLTHLVPSFTDQTTGILSTVRSHFMPALAPAR